jgi:hypothetical protein
VSVISERDVGVGPSVDKHSLIPLFIGRQLPPETGRAGRFSGRPVSSQHFCNALKHLVNHGHRMPTAKRGAAPFRSPRPIRLTAAGDARITTVDRSIKVVPLSSPVPLDSQIGRNQRSPPARPWQRGLGVKQARRIPGNRPRLRPPRRCRCYGLRGCSVAENLKKHPRPVFRGRRTGSSHQALQVVLIGHYCTKRPGSSIMRVDLSLVSHSMHCPQSELHVRATVALTGRLRGLAFSTGDRSRPPLSSRHSPTQSGKRRTCTTTSRSLRTRRDRSGRTASSCSPR